MQVSLGKIHSREHWQSKMGTLWATHLDLCCCSPGHRLFCCSKQELENWLAVSGNSWEGQERLVCLRQGSLPIWQRCGTQLALCCCLWAYTECCSLKPGMRNVYSTSSAQIQIEIHVLLNVSLLWRKRRRNISKTPCVLPISSCLVC